MCRPVGRAKLKSSLRLAISTLVSPLSVLGPPPSLPPYMAPLWTLEGARLTLPLDKLYERATETWLLDCNCTLSRFLLCWAGGTSYLLGEIGPSLGAGSDFSFYFLPGIQKPAFSRYEKPDSDDDPSPSMSDYYASSLPMLRNPLD